jgi:5'-deoxynucleotidase YfbR-like HD superfamily hydrolase
MDLHFFQSVCDAMAMHAVADDPDYLGWYSIRQMIRAESRLGQITDVVTAGMAVKAELALDEALGRYELESGDRYRVGDWIPTVSGRRLWIADPRPDEVEPYDVAYGLSRLPRYNGMTDGPPYSVAQHSVLVSYEVAPPYALHGLLHDAHEYVAMDITSPLKRLLGVGYAAVERRLKDAVASRFGLEWTAEAESEVKRADNLLMATEVRWLTSHRVICGELPALPSGTPIVPWSEAEAFRAFAARLNDLVGREVVVVQDADR